MEKIITWVADDGTVFDNENECEEYERRKDKLFIFENLECYTSAKLRIYPADVDDFELEEVYFIKIGDGTKDEEQAAYRAFVDYTIGNCYYELDFSYKSVLSDIVYYNDDMGWSSLRQDIAELTQTLNEFGLPL